MTLLVAIDGWPPEPWRTALKLQAPSLEVRLADEPYDPAAIRYACVWRPERGLLARLPRLEVIFNLGAGVDALLEDPTIPDVPIVRIVDADLTARMSEWVVLQVLLHHRRHLDYARQQRDRVWRGLPQPPASAVRVGVMGLGVLGRDAADKLAHLGFDVAGWSRSPKALPGMTSFAGEGEREPFLQRTDVLVVLLPLTADTRQIIDRALIDELARDGVLGGPVLINAGRGGLQVEADILSALDDGTLIGASLDVFETEPLPPESRFWLHPRVVVTPHCAADSEPVALVRNVLDQIARHEAGLPLRNVVDRRRGY